MTGADRETEVRANELYWSSTMSVNQIADEMDLSKGTLYGLIRPRPAGLSCPDCADELVYANRTAKDRGMVACPQCGWEGEEADAETQGAEEGVNLPVMVDPDAAPASVGTDADRRRVILGGALLGAAAGLALVFWSKRR